METLRPDQRGLLQTKERVELLSNRELDRLAEVQKELSEAEPKRANVQSQQSEGPGRSEVRTKRGEQMQTNEPITVSRDCDAIQIPSGEKVILPVGTQVTITQSLGGTHTVMTNQGWMARIESKDADAIGKESTGPEAEKSAAAESPADLDQLVRDQLKTCFDPEIPVNIVDLGLVYHCQVMPLPDGGNKVDVKFTLTAPGCGMGQVLIADIGNKILNLSGVKEIDVEVVFDPPWDPSMMSDAAKLQLGFM
jgi:probable FeS assembly SUF system protein SufT